MDPPGMLDDEISSRLSKHVPLELALSWDNVGIIVQPSRPIIVKNILLTIDLNETIVEEAIAKQAQYIISYHPPIFQAVNSLTRDSWKARTLLKCIENQITVYSPHSALDTVEGGMTDWLVAPFVEKGLSKVTPLQYSKSKSETSRLEVHVNEPSEKIADALKGVSDVIMTGHGDSNTTVAITCNQKSLPNHLEAISHLSQSSSKVVKLDEKPILGTGLGRLVTLKNPLPLHEVIRMTKKHLGLEQIYSKLATNHTLDSKISSIVACPGSSASILRGCRADVWILGEMSHHEILDATYNGSTVLLGGHTNTERGFLSSWANHLHITLFQEQVGVMVSDFDRDESQFI